MIAHGVFNAVLISELPNNFYNTLRGDLEIVEKTDA